MTAAYGDPSWKNLICDIQPSSGTHPTLLNIDVLTSSNITPLHI